MTTPLPFFLLASVLILLAGKASSRPQENSLLEAARSVVSKLDVKTKIKQHNVEVSMVETPVISTPTHIPQHLLNLLLEKEIEEFALGEGEHLMIYPLKNNATNKQDIHSARYQFKLSSDSKPISSMHVWIQKKIQSKPMDVMACFSTSLQEDQSCENREKLLEVKYESSWSIFELPLKYYIGPGTGPLFCTIEIFGLPMQEYGDRKPFVVANLNHAAAKRKRRSTNNVSDKSCACCVVDYYISFKELDWSWIVSPLGFHANICYGKCSYQLDSYPSHYHKIMSLTLMNKTTSVENKDDLWKPQCSPTRFKPLEVIYAPSSSINNGSSDTFVVQIIPDMITESCGCF